MIYKIKIQLNDKILSNDILFLNDKTRSEIYNTIKRAKRIDKAKKIEENRLKEMNALYEKILQGKLTKREVILATESNNLSSIILRFKNFLKDKPYDLKKFTKNKVRYYELIEK